MHILMAPDYRAGNPYQDLLARSLNEAGAVVQFPVGYRRGLPLYRALRDMSPRPDVLHLHWSEAYLKGNNALTRGLYAEKFLLDLRLARRLTGRLVWTVHNRVAHESKHPQWELGVARRTAAVSDRLIVHSEANRAEISEAYRVSPDKFAVIPMGHYRDVYRPPVGMAKARQELGLPTAGRVILHLGMLRPYKGIEQLLETWSQREPDLAEALLLIVGNPRDEEYRAEPRATLRVRLKRAVTPRVYSR